MVRARARLGAWAVVWVRVRAKAGVRVRVWAVAWVRA